MAGIDLRRVALQSGSEMVQRSGSDPVGQAIGGFGQALVQTGQFIQERKDKRELERQKMEEELQAERQKMEEELQAERQKIYDIRSEGHVKRAMRAARDAATITAKTKGSTPTDWFNSHEASMKEVEKAYGEVFSQMDPEKAERLRQSLEDFDQDQRGALRLATVVYEENAMRRELENDAYELARDPDSSEENADQIKDIAKQLFPESKMEQDKFFNDIWGKGMWAKYSRGIEELADANDVDGLKETLSELEKNEDLESAGELALKTTRAIRRIQEKQTKVYNAYTKEVTKFGELDFIELEKDIAEGNLSEEQGSLVKNMVPDAKAAVERKEEYEFDKRSPIYVSMRRNGWKEFFDRRAEGKNVSMTESEQKDRLKSIKESGLGNWAQADLYGVHLQAVAASVAEDDDAFFSAEVGSAMDDNQRLWWTEYLNRAAKIIGGKDVDGPWDQVIQDDVSTMENMFKRDEFPKDKKGQQELMDRMIQPYLQGRLRAELSNETESGEIPDGVSAELWNVMTPEQKELWQ